MGDWCADCGSADHEVHPRPSGENALLAEWLDLHPEPCRYDHDDACQAHYLHERPCLVERTRAAIQEAK